MSVRPGVLTKPLNVPPPPLANRRPTFDRTLKPSAGGPDDASASLLQGHLRTVIVPGDTMAQFLSLAAANTAANVETCGILAGSMAQHRLRITHVIVPHQKGTADSCTTMCEEDIFDVQDQQNLITLGWIHVRMVTMMMMMMVWLCGRVN